MFQRLRVEREAYTRANEVADRRINEHWNMTEQVKLKKFVSLTNTCGVGAEI